MDIGQVKERKIIDEMKESYLDYAMSVIVSRALPDVRDGLKPVHRRILYAMHDLGLRSSAKFKKSAAVVGDCIAKYHPHGDAAVYDSLVRMAQHFSLRYPLVEGQGNFGSIDGDSAAAYRYTEARMTPVAEELLSDIEKDTVDFADNYDASRKEPTVLPARFPNLLVNGSMGIAVGMATNIAPHNVGEVLDGLIALIDNKEIDVRQLYQHIQGPDFPTGGIIYDKNDIINAYASGRGPVVIRAKTLIEETKRGHQIIVSEIPYQVNKAELIVKIAELVKAKKMEGIKDVRDESDKEGIRLVIELKHDSIPQKTLNNLFKYTDLQKTFHFNMVALVDGIQPQTLSLKGILEHFLEHRRIVVTRRSQYELARARERAHILEGLKKALDHIDKVIETIKKSASREDAHANLMKKFKLSDKQATAILEMRLQTLAGLERKKINDELKEKKELIAHLEALLKSPKKLMGVVKDEFKELKEKYADERRTKVIKSGLKEIGDEELIPEEDALFVLTKSGYIKRMSPQELRVQKRGGKGLVGMTTKEEDVISNFFLANTHDTILFFTSSGKVFRVRGYDIPEASRTSRGKALVNFLNIAASERVTASIPVSKEFMKRTEEKGASNSEKGKAVHLFMTTKHGVVKKVALEEFLNIRQSGMLAIRLRAEDELRWVRWTSTTDEIMLFSADGNAIRFKDKDVRPMGRTASGVTGMRLSVEDEIVGMETITSKENAKVLIVSEHGYGKRTDLKYYKLQKRAGRGIKTAKVTAKTGKIVSAQITDPDDKEIIIISRKGTIIRTALTGAPILGRATQGVRIMKMGADDAVASVVTA